MVNLKHIAFDTVQVYLCTQPNDLLISRLSLLRHIEKIECKCRAIHISIIKTLMQQCKNQIEMFDVTVNADDYTQFNLDSFPFLFHDYYTELRPLELPNCEVIRTNNIYVYPIWTKKCKNLEIKNEIDKEWCKHVINKCDCTGIDQFTSEYFAFGIDVSDDDSTVFTQFSQKFVNLKQLNIDVEKIVGNRNYFGCYDTNISKISLIELFYPIIIKNNGSIHLIIGSSATHSLFAINSMIEQFVKKNGVNNSFIKHVSVNILVGDRHGVPNSRTLIQLCCKDVEWLKCVFFGTEIKQRTKFVEYIVACLRNMNNNSASNINDDDDNDNKVSELYAFGSIQVIDLKSMLWVETSLIINEILGTQEMIDIFSKHGIFCCITQEYSNNCDKTKFEEICDWINLILQKQIAIDVEITFHNVEINNCKEVFESYFGNINKNNCGNTDDDNQATVLKQYKGAKCNDNKYCVGLKFAQVSIWNRNGVYCRFVNAQYVQ